VNEALTTKRTTQGKFHKLGGKAILKDICADADAVKQVPGPGAYEPIVDSTGRAYNMTETLGSPQTFLLGPRVDPNRYLNKKMSRSERFGKQSPGPAQYYVTTKVHIPRAERSFTLTSRPLDLMHAPDKTANLGPGAYPNVSYKAVEPTPLTYSFSKGPVRLVTARDYKKIPYNGKKNSQDLIGVHSPGPAQYTCDSRPDIPKIRDANFAGHLAFHPPKPIPPSQLKASAEEMAS